MAPKSASDTAELAPATPESEQAPTVGLNVAAVAGTVSSDPIHKELPSGSVLVAFSVSVRTAADSQATSLPIVWFDPPANAATIERGLPVVVTGTLARRFFRAGGQTQSRTELVARRVEPARRKATCRRLLDAAGGEVLEFSATALC